MWGINNLYSSLSHRPSHINFSEKQNHSATSTQNYLKVDHRTETDGLTPTSSGQLDHCTWTCPDISQGMGNTPSLSLLPHYLHTSCFYGNKCEEFTCALVQLLPPGTDPSWKTSDCWWTRAGRKRKQMLGKKRKKKKCLTTCTRRFSCQRCQVRRSPAARWTEAPGRDNSADTSTPAPASCANLWRKGEESL